MQNKDPELLGWPERKKGKDVIENVCKKGCCTYGQDSHPHLSDLRMQGATSNLLSKTWFETREGERGNYCPSGTVKIYFKIQVGKRVQRAAREISFRTGSRQEEQR